MAFLDTVSRTPGYVGMRSTVPMPSPSEASLLGALARFTPRSREDLSRVAPKVHVRQADLLGAFSIRMATLAVRQQDTNLLHLGTFALVMDDDVVDYRDILLTLAVLDDASARIGADFGAVIADAAVVATKRQQAIIDGYLSRPPDLRGIAVMGITASGSGIDFLYQTRGAWSV